MPAWLAAIGGESWLATALMLLAIGALATVLISTARTARVSARSIDALRAALARFRSAFDSAPIGMALFSVEDATFGRFLQVNPALCKITGRSEQDLLARGFQDLIHPEDRGVVEAEARSFLTGAQTTYQAERRYLHAAGHEVPVLANVSLVRDRVGRPLYAVSQIQDISERKTLESVLKFQADHDDLTGLYNRRRFAEELSRHLARSARYGNRGALLMVDLDRFKQVNDTHGHGVGDLLIRLCAEAFSRRLRQTDILARFGGDEFAILLTDADLAEATAVAASLVQTIRALSVGLDDGSAISATTSVGVALIQGENAPMPEDLMIAADRALYDAKAAGRDTFAVYESQVAD